MAMPALGGYHVYLETVQLLARDCHADHFVISSQDQAGFSQRDHPVVPPVPALAPRGCPLKLLVRS